MVTPWYKSASSGLWTQAGELTSGKVFLSVRIAGEVTFCPFYKNAAKVFQKSCRKCIILSHAMFLLFFSPAVWESLKLPLLYGASASLGNNITKNQCASIFSGTFFLFKKA